MLLPELYLYGLASVDFELSLQGLLGTGRPCRFPHCSTSKRSGLWNMAVTRVLIERCQAAYLWTDGVYVKAGLGTEKTALLLIIGAMQDGSKHVLAVEVRYRESKDSWSVVLRHLKQRGLTTVRLVAAEKNFRKSDAQPWVEHAREGEEFSDGVKKPNSKVAV